MAMTKCPECKKEISDRAEFCPHCGLPFIERQKRKKSFYKIRKGEVKSYGFATFFTFLAWFLWIGGLIVAISGANVVKSVDRWGDVETEFSFIQFLTIFLTYLLYGSLAYGMSSVLQKFSGMYDMLSGFYLEREQEDETEEIKRISIEQISMEEEQRKAREERERLEAEEKAKEKELSGKIRDAYNDCDKAESLFLKRINPVRTFDQIESEWEKSALGRYYPVISDMLADAKKKEKTPAFIRDIKESIMNMIIEDGGHKSAQIVRSFSEEEMRKIIDELCNKTFDKKPNGYAVKEVDDFLDEICDEIEQRSGNPDLYNDKMLRRDQVDSKEFSREESGYDTRQVKAYLKEVTEKVFV